MILLSGETGIRVLIEQSSNERQIGNIIIPETAGEKPLMGKVIATSESFMCPKNGLLKPVVNVGDIVLYMKHTGAVVEVDDKELILVMEHNIYGIL
jgi:chaperonin GroES